MRDLIKSAYIIKCLERYYHPGFYPIQQSDSRILLQVLLCLSAVAAHDLVEVFSMLLLCPCHLLDKFNS